MDDELFPQGWGNAADAVLDGTLTIEGLVSGLEKEGVSAETLIAGHLADLEMIAAATAAEAPTEPKVPDIISATSFVALENDNLEAWDLIRPLPSRPTYARRLGTEVHRIIEERNRGISPFADETELDEPSALPPPSTPGEPSKIEQMLARFEELGYADRTIATLPSGEPMIELPFVMKTESGQIIRGRIDAVYETEDGALEIVDWKTGMEFDAKPGDQLEIYRAALAAAGVPGSASLKISYAFLKPQ